MSGPRATLTQDAVAGSDAPKIVVRTVMDLPPKKIWQIVSDCARYKDRLPRVAASASKEPAGALGAMSAS